jgi:hypothetical protein
MNGSFRPIQVNGLKSELIFRIQSSKIIEFIVYYDSK